VSEDPPVALVVENRVAEGAPLAHANAGTVANSHKVDVPPWERRDGNAHRRLGLGGKNDRSGEDGQRQTTESGGIPPDVADVRNVSGVLFDAQCFSL